MSEIQVFIENPEALGAASIKFTKVLFDIWYDRQLMDSLTKEKGGCEIGTEEKEGMQEV